MLAQSHPEGTAPQRVIMSSEGHLENDSGDLSSSSEQDYHSQRVRNKDGDFILSVLSLSQWLRTFGARTDRELTSVEDTFVDHLGVKRFVSNWQVAPEQNFSVNSDPLLSEKAFYSQTGCTQVHVFCAPSSQPIHKSDSTRLTNRQGEVIVTSFLNDWQRLWQFLEADPEDEIARQAPLFRLAVEFFFHRRTYQIITWLILYNILVTLIVHFLYPIPNGTYFMAYVILTFVVQWRTYCSVYVLFKGTVPSLFHRKTKLQLPMTGTEVNDAQGTVAHKSPQRVFTYSLCAATLELLRTIGREIPSLMSETTQRQDVDYLSSTSTAFRRSRKQQLSYYDLLNISLKFFVRHNGESSRTINWNRFTYRLSIVLIVMVLPLFLTGNIIGDYIDSASACHRGDRSDYCQYRLWLTVLLGGHIIDAMQSFLMGGGILMAMIGLAYGGDLAFRLSDSWMEKFCCLRRLQLDDDEDICFPVNSSRHSVDLDTQTSQSGTVETFSTPADLRSEKRILAQRITIDATEHYLFVREVMAAADRLWSPALTVIFILAAYLVFEYTIYGMMMGGRNVLVMIRALIYAWTRFALLVLYPIASISHANAHIDKLTKSFSSAAPDDYQLLGEKSRWLLLTSSSPAVWTFFGVWLTWDKLFGLIWTSAAATFAFIFSSFVVPAMS